MKLKSKIWNIIVKLAGFSKIDLLVYQVIYCMMYSYDKSNLQLHKPNPYPPVLYKQSSSDSSMELVLNPI